MQCLPANSPWTSFLQGKLHKKNTEQGCCMGIGEKSCNSWLNTSVFLKQWEIRPRLLLIINGNFDLEPPSHAICKNLVFFEANLAAELSAAWPMLVEAKCSLRYIKCSLQQYIVPRHRVLTERWSVMVVYSLGDSRVSCLYDYLLASCRMKHFQACWCSGSVYQF